MTASRRHWARSRGREQAHAQAIAPLNPGSERISGADCPNRDPRDA
jgi:hypothetical protein